MHGNLCERARRDCLPHPQPFIPQEKGVAVNVAPEMNQRRNR